MSPRLSVSFIAATNVTCIWQPGELFTPAGSGRDITGLGGASAARLSQSWVAVLSTYHSSPLHLPASFNKVFMEPQAQSGVGGQGASCWHPSSAPLPSEPPGHGRGEHHPGVRYTQPSSAGSGGDRETECCALFPAASGRSCSARALPAPASRAHHPCRHRVRSAAAEHRFLSRPSLFSGAEGGWKQSCGCSTPQMRVTKGIARF